MSLAVSKTAFTKFQEPVVVKILSGEHFSHESVQALGKVATIFFSILELQKLNEEDLHFKELGTRNILLIFPGAAELKKISLTVEQQEEINLHARTGNIKVLAVCAGAFFASESIIYDDQKRHEDKKLCLFKGSSCGPAFPSEDPRWTISSQQISCEFRPEEEKGYVTMIGGGFFLPSPKLVEGKDYCVISRYSTLPGAPIAALTCIPNSEGNFNVALIGPHAEYEGYDECFFFLKQGFPDKALKVDQITQDLSGSSSFRKHLFHFIFSRLGFK